MAECPKEALRDTALPTAARLVLVALWHRAGREKRFVWPSRATLAADVGSNERTLRRNLAILRDRGWIREHIGDETGGNPGWYLCDPPGVPQVLGIDAPLGTHDAAVTSDRGPATNGPGEATNDRTPVPDRPPMTAEAATNDRPYSIGTNQEPGGGGCARAREDDDRQRREGAQPPPPPASLRRGPDVSAWSCDFRFAWEAHVQALGVHISNPTVGAAKVVELQRMLDEHGGDVVRDVLLHAASEVARRLQTGDERVGIDPRFLGVVFRADKPQAFDARLDAWQRDQGRKRVSGRVPVAPAELDGEPLTDEEQRVWMRAGDDPEGAVRRARVEAAEMADLFSGIGLSLPDEPPPEVVT